ncbi:MAG: hypothetical protein HY766_16730 [candidate division NC10 bacterium]|nr:hypothetical protein [candidate division NC10 bacterium]
MVRKPVPLDEAIEATLALARPQAEKAGVALASDIPPDLPPVLADPVRLRQILFNLLSNAIKFTPAGGRITLRAFQKAEGTKQKAEGGEQQGADACVLPSAGCLLPSGEKLPAAECRVPPGWPSLVIEVTDTGLGIKAEDIPKLFTEFGQLDAGRAPEKRGTGLGLALTKKLVELHGGRIWVESEGKGRGTTFAFTLPFAGSAGVRRET